MYEFSKLIETFTNHECPPNQWEKLGIDLFHQVHMHFLVPDDFFVNYCKIDSLEKTNDNGSNALIFL